MRVRGWLTPMLAFALLSLPALLRAQADAAPPNHLYDKWQFTVAGTTVILGSNARVDPEDGGTGNDVDLEDDLGLDRSTFQGRLSMRWRPGRRHELEAGYQFIGRSAHRVLQDTIVFADTTFPAGFDVRTKFNSDNAFLTYRFAFMAKENTQVGVGVGLGALFLGASLDGIGFVDPDTVEVSESFDQVAPIGSVGLYGRFRFADKWHVNADARAIGITIDRFDISVLEGGLSTQYFFSPKWGAELGWSYSGVEVEFASESGGRTAKIEYDFQTARLGVVFVP
jgi:hypothetical protein